MVRWPARRRGSHWHHPFVGAIPVHRRQRRPVLPEVNRELATVMVPVVQHHGTEKRPAWNRPKLPISLHHSPGGSHLVVAHSSEYLPSQDHTGVEFLENLGSAVCLGTGSRSAHI